MDVSKPHLDIKSIYQGSKGTVVVIQNLKTQTREEVTNFWKTQKINGYPVKDVETNCIPIIRKGSHIGLLLGDGVILS